VDQHGTVLNVLVQRRRDKKAAQKFFRKLLKGLQYVPRAIRYMTPMCVVCQEGKTSAVF